MLKSLHQFCQDISGSIIMVKIKGKDNTFNKDVKVRSEKKCNMHCYGFWEIIYIIVMWLSINIALESLPIGTVVFHLIWQLSMKMNQWYLPKIIWTHEIISPDLQ